MELQTEILNTIKCYIQAEIKNKFTFYDDFIIVLLSNGTKAKITIR